LFGPPPSALHIPPPHALLLGITCSTLLFSDFVEEKNIKDNKKNTAFLLAWVKIAIQKDF
jgi:hypothetical protein